MKKIYQTSISKLLFDIQNAREIILHKESDVNSFIHTVNEHDGKILSIKHADIEIAVNKDFTIDDETYHITSINESKEFYTLYISKINKITLFSLPMFFENRDIASTSNLINVHYGYEGYKEPNDNLYFHYRYSSMPQFKETERTLTSSEYFISESDVDTAHIVYETKVPTKWLLDWNKIIEGKYSTISSVYKLKLIKFHNLKANKYLHQVIYRSKILLDKMQKELDVTIPDNVDLMSKIDLSRSKFTLKNSIKKKDE